MSPAVQLMMDQNRRNNDLMDWAHTLTLATISIFIFILLGPLLGLMVNFRQLIHRTFCTWTMPMSRTPRTAKSVMVIVLL